MLGPWDYNEHGAWCPSCGGIIANSFTVEDEDWWAPEECRQCGYPDDAEKMAEYFT